MTIEERISDKVKYELPSDLRYFKNYAAREIYPLPTPPIPPKLSDIFSKDVHKVAAKVRGACLKAQSKTREEKVEVKWFYDVTAKNWVFRK